jgi:tetratricopeptide (TPR) repeat protein
MARGADKNRWASLGICAALIAATAVVYGRTVGFGFVAFDDEIYVYENPHIKPGITLRGVKWAFTQVHESNWHPLTTLSHMLDCSLYGLWAGGHHLTNLLLHATSAVVLFLALRRMTGAVWQSAMVAALFCVHPLHVESVAWVSERKDVLSGLFFGLTLWAYAAYVEGKAAYWIVAAAFTLGLLSKPMLVTAPFLLLLLDYWPLGRWSAGARAALVLEKLPLLTISAAICVTTYLVQRSRGAINEQASVMLRLQTALLAYGSYLLKTIVPLNLAANYPLRPQPAILACCVWFLVLACISASAILLARRGAGYAAVGWFWFLGMIVPVSGIVMIGDQSMADRYTYLSLTGVFIAVVFTIGGFLQSRFAALAAVSCAAVLAVLAVLSIVQVGYWHDSETLWRHDLAVAPNNALAHSNLAAVVHDRRPDGKAEAEMHIEEALRLRPDDALANNNYGYQLAEKGDWKGAERHYRIAVKSRPGFAEAHYNLGVALGMLKRAPEAEAALREALRLRPDYPAAENSLAGALEIEGRRAEAVAHYRRSVELDSSIARYHVELGTALVKLGLAQGNKQLVYEGIASCKTGVDMKPDEADAHSELAIAWFEATSPDKSVRNDKEAIELAERAVGRQHPPTPRALDVLAAAFAEAGRFEEAIDTGQMAKRAAAAMKATKLADEIDGRLKLYRDGKPYRDESLPH